MNTSDKITSQEIKSPDIASQETQYVRLTRDLGELQLHQGQVGILRGRWDAPTVAFDVEFQCNGSELRVLLLENFVAIEGPMRKAA
jgi:hypothetical protein